MKGYWPTPASADVPATETIGNHNGKLTPAMPSNLHFVGRYLDSQATGDFQQPFKTARAESVHIVGGRIYFQIGSAIFAYSAASFFSRLASGEQMVAANNVPVQNGFAWTRLSYPAGAFDEFLFFDAFFYAETSQSGWAYEVSDGQRRLFGFDVDDRGFVYPAYSVFGWGILNDSARQTDRQLIPSLYQDPSFVARSIAVVKSGAKYFALVNNGSDPVTNVYDVTDPQHVTLHGQVPYFVSAAVKSSDMQTVAFVGDGSVRIFDVATLIGGGVSLRLFPAASVTCDGANFWTTTDGQMIVRISPAGDRTDYAVPTSGMLQTTKLHYGDGYLVWSGYRNGLAALRVFKIGSDGPAEIDFAHFFDRYYVNNPDPKYTTPDNHNFFDSAVVRQGAETYLVVTGYSLGDVYELEPDGTVWPTPDPPPPVVTPPHVDPAPTPVPTPTPPPSGCPPIVPGQNVFITCSAPSGGSQLNPVFKVGEEIKFSVAGFNYDFSCAPHEFWWTIVGTSGDIYHSLDKSTIFKPPTAQMYKVTCRVTVNGKQTEIVQYTTVEGDAPVPQPTDLLLDRFKVEVVFKDHDGKPGSGQRIPCPALGNQTALFWFFAPTNLELSVKAIDGGEHHWIFYGSLTDVEFVLTVTDTIDGNVRSYRNEAGTMASVGDTSAF